MSSNFLPSRQEYYSLRIENERLKKLLREAHDSMDELNNNTPDGAVCWFCTEAGYDGTGIKHKEDCVLVKIRREIKTY